MLKKITQSISGKTILFAIDKLNKYLHKGDNKGIFIETEISVSIDKIVVNKKLFEYIIINLIQNAIDAIIDNNGKIKINVTNEYFDNERSLKIRLLLIMALELAKTI